jgi:hypothetical protein
MATRFIQNIYIYIYVYKQTDNITQIDFVYPLQSSDRFSHIMLCITYIND